MAAAAKTWIPSPPTKAFLHQLAQAGEIQLVSHRDHPCAKALERQGLAYCAGVRYFKITEAGRQRAREGWPATRPKARNRYDVQFAFDDGGALRETSLPTAQLTRAALRQHLVDIIARIDRYEATRATPPSEVPRGHP